jgi:hypothetical protein
MRANPGRIYVEPHQYDDRGHYLKYIPMDPTDRGFGLLFETNGNRVNILPKNTLAAGRVQRFALNPACNRF